MQYFIKRKHCPVCLGKSLTQLYCKQYSDPVISSYLERFYGAQGFIELEYLKNEMYSLLQCNDCRLIFQEFIPDDFILKKLYDEWIDPATVRKDAAKHPLSYYVHHAVEIANLASHFNVLPYTLKFLDFGMGWSEWLLTARGFGCNSYGMELSTERISYAQQQGIKIVDWDEVPSCGFDYINTEQVFEHIVDPLGTLTHLAKGLKTGGIIKISVPNGNNFLKRVHKLDWNAPKFSRNSPNVVAPLEHLNCYSTETLKTLAKICGLTEIKVPVRYVFYSSVKEYAKAKLRRGYRRLVYGGDTSLYFGKV